MKLRRTSALLVASCLVAIPGAGVTLPWDKDMRDQPSMKPQDSVVETNQTSVPVGGKDHYEPPKDIIELVRTRLEAGRTLVNPVGKSPESLARGRQMYELHCQVCHGDQGRGDGPVGIKFVPQPMELNLDYVQLQPDGQLYYTISHGSIAMPGYWQSISPEDRWHLINFIKEVFGES
jgi:mono/diheme cytochrome c family protein